jgi:hypothetical protein
MEALASLTGLTTLSLHYWSDSDELTANSLSALTPLTALSTLQLNNQTSVFLSGRCLMGLAPLNALTSLNLGYSILADDSLRALAPLTGLTGLHLSQCFGGNMFTGNMLVTAEGLRALALLTRLTDLDLLQCGPRVVTDESLRTTLAPLTGLTRLNLSSCEIQSLTTQGLTAAVSPLTRLTALLPPAREGLALDTYEGNLYGDYSEDDEFHNNSSDDSYGYDNLYGGQSGCGCGECGRY